MATHTVEKIGGTSMSDYPSVRDNIFLSPDQEGGLYNRVFVVSAYGGMTDQLLEHKRTDKPGVYALFAKSDNNILWQQELQRVGQAMQEINAELFRSEMQREQADTFIVERVLGAMNVLMDLQRVCSYGHFELEEHLLTVRELLASIGEAHSAFNTALLLRDEGINAHFVDLTGWREEKLPLDEKIQQVFSHIDLTHELPIVTGYALCQEGLMRKFDRGYSELTFSRIAVLTQAREAIIHKEYHLSSADPRLVDENKAIPIGRTNYDVVDQLSNLGMEAIHPKAAKGLRKQGIPLRVKSTFEPKHTGTLITGDYVSDKPCVEIITGRKSMLAIEVFDQDMVGDFGHDAAILSILERFKVKIISKDINANTITHFVDSNLKTVNRIIRVLQEQFPNAEINFQKVAIVSAIGSDMQVPGILSKAVKALADAGISVLAIHQSMRQVDMQFVVAEESYEMAVKSLHQCLIETHNHEYAICAA